jgi:hypothetical protein
MVELFAPAQPLTQRQQSLCCRTRSPRTMNGTSSQDICDFPQWRMALEATGCGQAEPQLHHTLHLETAVFATPCAWHESFQRDSDKRNSAHTSHNWARNLICGPQTTPQLQHRGSPSWKTAGQINTCGVTRLNPHDTFAICKLER